MKPDRPDTKKQNTRRNPDKSDIEKGIKPDIVKLDKPNIKKDIKLDIAKLDDKLNTKKKPDKSSDMGRRKNLQISEYTKQLENKKGNNTEKRKIVWIFWNDDYISELCEKWIHCDSSYAYTRFEELRKRSGEILFTN